MHEVRAVACRIALAAVLLLLALAPARAAPAVCTVGTSVEALYDLDMGRDTLSATLWVWTVCPASLPRQPLETIEFPTAQSLTRTPIEVTDLGDGRTYASQRVSGTFRFNWEMDAYPFDRQDVVIPFDETEMGADLVVFEPDSAQSFLSAGVAPTLREWTVSPLTLTTGVEPAESGYGLPGVGRLDFAEGEVAFTLDRASVVPFLKLTSGVIAAAFIAFFSFFFDSNDPGTFGGKLGLLIGVLFAVLVNMRSADSALGDTADMTLVTEIHLATLAFIVALALLALIDKIRVEAGATLPHPHWLRLTLIGVGYLGVVGLMIGRAMTA